MYSHDPNDLNYTNQMMDIEFSVEKCDKDIHNITCPSELDFQKNLNSSNKMMLKYMLIDYSINPKNFSYPIRQYENEFPDITIIKTKQFYKYHTFSLNEVQSDDGFIIENQNKQYFLEHDSMSEREGSDKSFVFSMYISLSKKYVIYTRTYLKVQGLLAEVQGFMSLVEYCVIFVYSYYSDNEFSVTMINKAFNLEIKESWKEKDNINLDIFDSKEKSKKGSGIQKFNVNDENKKNEVHDVHDSNGSLDSSSRMESISIDNVLDAPLHTKGINIILRLILFILFVFILFR